MKIDLGPDPRGPCAKLNTSPYKIRTPVRARPESLLPFFMLRTVTCFILGMARLCPISRGEYGRGWICVSMIVNTKAVSTVDFIDQRSEGVLGCVEGISSLKETRKRICALS